MGNPFCGSANPHKGFATFAEESFRKGRRSGWPRDIFLPGDAGTARHCRAAFGTQHSAKAETQSSAVSPSQADQRSTNGEAPFAISHDGKLVAQERIAAVSNGDSEVEMLPSTIIPPAADRPSAKADGKNRVADISCDDISEADPPEANFNALDARDMEEATRRGKEFETRHPWLWDEDRYASVGEPINSMHLVWWGEFIKAVYPELAAAALDPAKCQAYIDNYDHDRPIPLNEPGEDEEEDFGADAPRCQYIKADGEQCGSPALKRKRLCHFHSKTAEGRKRKKNVSADAQPGTSLDLELPVLEDDRAIQMAVTNICRQLAREVSSRNARLRCCTDFRWQRWQCAERLKKGTESFSNPKILGFQL